jgi:hypothetical protein
VSLPKLVVISVLLVSTVFSSRPRQALARLVSIFHMKVLMLPLSVLIALKVSTVTLLLWVQLLVNALLATSVPPVPAPPPKRDAPTTTIAHRVPCPRSPAPQATTRLALAPRLALSALTESTAVEPPPKTTVQTATTALTTTSFHAQRVPTWPPTLELMTLPTVRCVALVMAAECQTSEWIARLVSIACLAPSLQDQTTWLPIVKTVVCAFLVNTVPTVCLHLSLAPLVVTAPTMPLTCKWLALQDTTAQRLEPEATKIPLSSSSAQPVNTAHKVP